MVSEVTRSPLDVRALVALLDALATDGEVTGQQLRAAGDVVVAAGADPLALLDAAQRLGAQVGRDRRRSRELAALFASARELAELADLDTLLSRLVDRARDLLDVDLAYLSQFDPASGELHVRATAGVVSERFRRLQVPPGVGIAAKVAATRQPQWTDRYDTADIPHAPHIDVATREEGLVALLGVPMATGEEILGVLFAGNRSERTFAPEQIALLGAFADHAAVIVRGARLLDRSRRSTAAAEAESARADAHVRAMERASALHIELTESVLRGASIADVAGRLARWLGRRVRAVDERLRIVADSADDDEAGAGTVTGDRSAAPSTWDPAVRDGVWESQTTGRCVEVVGHADGVDVVVAAVASEVLLGALLIGPGSDGAPEALERRTIERAAQATALLTLNQRAVAEAEERVRGDLVADLVAEGGVDAPVMARRARGRGIELDDLGMVVVIAVAEEQRRAALRATTEALGGSGLAGLVDDRVVALAPHHDADDLVTHLHARVTARTGGPAICVVAAPIDTLDEIAAGHLRASRCADLLTALGVTDVATATTPYEVYAALFGTDRERIDSVIDSAIGPVLAWDAARGTDLAETLRCYSESQGSAAAAASMLHVHPNTVLQRLERVTALLGAGWRTPDELFRITVAVRMHDLRRRLGARAR